MRSLTAGFALLVCGHAVAAIEVSQTLPPPPRSTQRLRVAARLSQAAAQAPATVTSRITVIVPDDAVELSFENELTNTTGMVRDLESPPLEPRRTYEYSFSAKWSPNNYTTITRQRTVQFKAGEPVNVDLTIDSSNDRAQIRYVPTPDFVVDEMIRLAGVKSDDVTYEPGCGDGRITIAAVRAGARRGVGIDLDAERVAESQENVKVAHLTDKIEIRLGDALEINDLSEASVVFLYMGDEFDMMIRPILWKQLKVGTRVVSHRFTMGDWKPDETVQLDRGEGETYLVHRWTVTQEVKDNAAKP